MNLQSNTVSHKEACWVLYFSADTWKELYNKANISLQVVKTWLDTNLLTLNISKTKFLSFAISAKTADLGNYHLKIHECHNPTQSNCNCTAIEKVKVVTYLGIQVDQKLTWQNHIEKLSGRVRKLVYFFKRTRNILNPKLLMTVYYALCQSILTYCISAWGGAYKSHLIRLERSQRMVLKIMLGKSYRYSTEQLYKDANVLTVRQLYISNIISNLEIDSVQKITRRRPMLPILKVNTAFARRHNSFMSAYVYNKICKTIDLQDMTKREKKSQLLKYLKELNYQTTEYLLE